MSIEMCLKNYPNVHKFISIKPFQWAEWTAFSLINISNIYRFFLFFLRPACFSSHFLCNRSLIFVNIYNFISSLGRNCFSVYSNILESISASGLIINEISFSDFLWLENCFLFLLGMKLGMIFENVALSPATSRQQHSCNQKFISFA